MTKTRRPLFVALAFVALLLVGSSVAPAPPEFGSSADAIRSYYREHQDAIALQAWLVMASVLFGPVLVGYVARILAPVERVWFIVTAVAGLSIVAVGMLFRVGLAAHPETADPGAVALLSDVEAYWGPLATLIFASQALAIVVAARAGSVPAWLGGLSLAFAIEQLAESASIFGNSGFLAPGGDMNALVGPLFYAIWSVGLGVAAGRVADEEAPS